MTIDDVVYTWSDVPSSYQGLVLTIVREDSAISVKARTPRRQVVLLFDKSVEPLSGGQRVEVTIFRYTGLSTPTYGVLGT